MKAKQTPRAPGATGKQPRNLRSAEQASLPQRWWVLSSQGLPGFQTPRAGNLLRVGLGPTQKQDQARGLTAVRLRYGLGLGLDLGQVRDRTGSGLVWVRLKLDWARREASDESIVCWGPKRQVNLIQDNPELQRPCENFLTWINCSILRVLH